MVVLIELIDWPAVFNDDCEELVDVVELSDGQDRVASGLHEWTLSAVIGPWAMGKSSEVE
jgi:hypothetical protein